MFLLPDRHDFLETVDGVVTSLEGGAAMAAGDRNDDASLTDGHDADAVYDRDAFERPALSRRRADLAHLGERHLRIGFVLEAGHAAAVVVVARGPDEGHDGAGRGAGDSRGNRRRVNRMINDLVHVPPAGL